MLAVEITCKIAASAPSIDESMIHNVDSDKTHTVTGEVWIEFSECEVKKPVHCVVSEPIRFIAQFEGVEGLGPEKDAHGLEFKGNPDETAPTMSIFLEDKGAEKCALNKKELDIYGTAIATGAANPEAKHSGATWIFEPGNKMQALTIAGKSVEFTATFTSRMAGEYPIAYTTIT